MVLQPCCLAPAIRPFIRPEPTRGRIRVARFDQREAGIVEATSRYESWLAMPHQGDRLLRRRSSRRMSLPEFTLLPDGLPAIPRRHRPVGPKPLALSRELLRRQQLPQAVGERVAFANAIVPDRPHVEPPQLEHQEHFGGPPSDAAHDRESGDDLLIGETADAM